MKRGTIITTLAAVMLTAKLGKVEYLGHYETWYNLPMDRVMERAAANGIEVDYWERADGMKMNGINIICAGAKDRYGEIVQTSRGNGIILDYCENTENDPTLLDLATSW